MRHARFFQHWVRWTPTRATPKSTHAGNGPGMWEVDLDLHHDHFGPTHWCQTWSELMDSVQRDQPARIYLIADQNRERRVAAVLTPHDLTHLPRVTGHFPYLKYYRDTGGRSVSINFALESLTNPNN